MKFIKPEYAILNPKKLNNYLVLSRDTDKNSSCVCRCSICNKFFQWYRKKEWAYCPHCKVRLYD